jgi:hypothetical protein
MSDSLYIVGAHKDFVVFNDGNLSLDPITDTELERVQISHTGYASAAWSAGIDWYFVVSDDGISLFNVYSNRGWQCKKKTARFIELFLEGV